MDMDVNSLLDKLENIIAGAWRIPMTKGKCAVSVVDIQNLIDDIRLALPKEIKQAKVIVEDRNNILSDARQEAKNIVGNAQKQANYMVSETYIVKHSKRTASKILLGARQKTSEMRQNTNEYIENIIDNLEKVLQTTLKEFRTTVKETKQVIKKNKNRL